MIGKITVRRLTRIVEVVHFWDFIEGALKTLAEKGHTIYERDQVYKTLLWMMDNPEDAWVGIVFEDGEPQVFGVAQDCTPAFSNGRKFIIRWFYHAPAQFQLTHLLREAFETWGKEHHVVSYALTTERATGAAIKCFTSQRYGFKKAFLTFEKNL